MPLQDDSKQPASLPQNQKSADDFLNTTPATLFAANSPLVPPPGQQPATATSPDGVDSSVHSLSEPDGPASTPHIIFPPKPPKGEPDCKGWQRLCCFGDIFFDFDGSMSIDQCYPCKDSSPFSFYLFLSLSETVDCVGLPMTVATCTDENFLFADFKWFLCEHLEIVYCCRIYHVGEILHTFQHTIKRPLVSTLLSFLPFLAPRTRSQLIPCCPSVRC